MANAFQIALVIFAIFSIDFFVGYIVWKKIKLLGILLWMLGLLLGTILIVNYFVEVPSPIFWGSFVAYAAVAMITAFETARQEAGRRPI